MKKMTLKNLYFWQFLAPIEIRYNILIQCHGIFIGVKKLKNSITCLEDIFQGSTFPGAYAPRFCCGPLDFSNWGPEVVCKITRTPVFNHYFLSKDLFGPLDFNQCQTLFFVITRKIIWFRKG